MASPIDKIKRIINPSEFECVYAGPPVEPREESLAPDSNDIMAFSAVYAGPSPDGLIGFDTIPSMQMTYAAPDLGETPHNANEGDYPGSFAEGNKTHFCSSCGSRIDLSHKFCACCGARIDCKEEPPAEVEMLDVYAGPDMMP